jgi:hypothetical protein
MTQLASVAWVKCSERRMGKVSLPPFSEKKIKGARLDLFLHENPSLVPFLLTCSLLFLKN